jgi:hypothetical protein
MAETRDQKKGLGRAVNEERTLPPTTPVLTLPQVASATYHKEANRYKVDCGAKTDKKDTFGLQFWETSGWIMPQGQGWHVPFGPPPPCRTTGLV